MFQEKTKKFGVGEIIGIIVIFILAVLIVCTFVVYGVFRDSNAAPSLFGKRLYLMNGDGMEPRIKQGSVVFIEEGLMPEAAGNVILCSIDGRLAVVGYIGEQSVTMADGSVSSRYVVKYDATPADQTWTVEKSDIIGRAVSYDAFLGSVIRFASSKAGMLVIVIIPSAILVLYELIMLVLSIRKERTAMGDMDVDVMDVSSPSADAKPLDFGATELTGRKSDMEEKSAPDIDFGLTDRKPETRSTPLEFGFAENKTAAKEPAKDTLSFGQRFAYDEDVPAEKPIAPEPVTEQPKSEELSKAMQDVAQVLTSDKTSESDQSMTTRIDDLIKLLEEERRKLSEK